MHPFHERKLHLGFLIIWLIMVVGGLYVYCIPVQQKQQGESVARTQEVINQLANLSLHLTDAETGQRGYLLTGQAVYLQLYSLALLQIDDDMARFQQITGDNPRQQSQVPLLRVHIAAKLAELKQTIQLHDNLSREAALMVVLSGRGREQMQVIRRQIAQMHAEEQRLLQQRVAQWRMAYTQARWIYYGGGMLLYVLLGIVYMVARKEKIHRKRLLKVEQQATQIHRAEAERLAKVVAIQRDVACTGQDLQATMQVITERTQEITSADGSVVEMVEGDEMIYRAVSGSATPHLGLRLKTATSLSGRCVREKAVLECDDTETDERVDKVVCRKVGVRSMVVVPLQNNGQLIGVLKVMSSRRAAFTKTDVSTLELMAGLLSAALSDAFAMEALRTTEARLEEAQRIAHLGSWEFETATQKITWSKELFRLFGMAPEQGEPDYVTALTLHSPEEAARLEVCIQQAIREGIGYELDLQRTISEGETPRWYHAVGKPVFNAQGKVIRLVGTLLDITERKRHAREMQAVNEWLADMNVALEQRIQERTQELAANLSFQQTLAHERMAAIEALRINEAILTKQSQELLRSNSDLQQFAYMASHDLQEPLRMIGSYLELLQLEYSERLDDEAREYIAYAVDGAVRMKALINDLLAYSRVGTQGKPMETVVVHSLLAEVLADLQLLIAETNAVVTCDPLPTVSADASQLRLVFQNLISNAIKFQGEAAPRIHISAVESDGEWRISVQDNGIGMQTKHLERIFVIFQRLHNRSKYAGTGIGLAVCKRVVERYGGRIWVESELGSGTTFFFTLPVLP